MFRPVLVPDQFRRHPNLVGGNFPYAELFKDILPVALGEPSGGGDAPRQEGWQLMHDLPYPYGISQDLYGELFKSLGHHESGIQGFFMARADRLFVKPVIVCDSTTISTYSRNQHGARRGFNKYGNGLDAIKLLTPYSVKDSEPIEHAEQPGNVPDVICIDNAIEQFKCLGIDRPLVTTDTGYCNERNLCEPCRRNMKFLRLVDTDVKTGWLAVDTLRKSLESMGAVCPFDYHVSGAMMAVMHEFPFRRERSRKRPSSMLSPKVWMLPLNWIEPWKVHC